MKYLILICLLISCNKQVLQTQEEQPCDLPRFKPAVMLSDNCPNECLHVYEGRLNFDKDIVEVNCKTLNLDSEYFIFSIDRQSIKNVNGEIVPAFRIYNKKKAVWCAGDNMLFFSDCPGTVYRTYNYNNGDNPDMFVIPKPEFWPCFDAGIWIEFRLITRSLIF